MTKAEPDSSTDFVRRIIATDRESGRLRGAVRTRETS